MKHSVGWNHIVFNRKHHNDSWSVRTYASRVSRALDVRNKDQTVSTALDHSGLIRSVDTEK